MDIMEKLQKLSMSYINIWASCVHFIFLIIAELGQKVLFV